LSEGKNRSHSEIQTEGSIQSNNNNKNGPHLKRTLIMHAHELGPFMHELESFLDCNTKTKFEVDGNEVDWVSIFGFLCYSSPVNLLDYQWCQPFEEESD